MAPRQGDITLDEEDTERSEAEEEEDGVSHDITELMSEFTSMVKDGRDSASVSENLELFRAFIDQFPQPLDEENAKKFRLASALVIEYGLHLFQDENELELYLDWSIESLEKLERKTPPEDVEARRRLQLPRSRCLYYRFARSHSLPDIDEAIALQAGIPHSHRLRIDELECSVEEKLDLWEYLFAKARVEHEERSATVALAVELAELVLSDVDERDDDSSLWLKATNNLSLSYELRWKESKETSIGDLVQSVGLGYKVRYKVDEAAYDNEGDARMQAYANLSLRLLRAYNCYLTGNLEPWNTDLPYGESLKNEALHHLAVCVATECEIRSAKLKAVVNFVRELKSFHVGKGREIRAACYGMLQSCLDDVRRIVLGSLRKDQVDCLTTFYGLSRYAAAAALDAGKEPMEALRLLEEGRGLAMSIQLRAFDDIPEASASKSTLLDEYHCAQQTLRFAVAQAAEYHERALLVDEVLSLQRKVRNSGDICGTLDAPLSDEEVRTISHKATIIAIVLADIHSYAIAVTDNKVECIDLPNLKENELAANHEVLSPLLAQGVDGDNHATLYELMREALAMIWETTVAPILTHLGIYQGDESISHRKGIRICWIPTGVLGLYPLHAAGLTSEDGEGLASCTMDFVASSYVPNLKLLIRSSKIRDGLPPPSTGAADPGCREKPLAGVISMKTTPQDEGRVFADLPETESEVALVKRHFQTTNPETGASLCLDDADTTRHDAAMELLARQPAVLHISCHGDVDYDEPLDSTLFLSDWLTQPLTVRDLLSLNLRRGRLAVLSACSTAHGGSEAFLDETNHLASALYAAGYRTVMGSLWPAGASSMRCLLENFYLGLEERMAGLTPESVIEAFHVAVLELRESTRNEFNDYRDDPIEWTQFIMIGC